MSVLTRTISLYYTLASLVLLCLSCRHDEVVSFVTEQQTGGAVSQTEVVGLYILNEGNMGSNKCTLDYLDLANPGQATSRYLRNIYGERNPQTVMELGDVGNDIGIYGSRLWMVINCSNKVEVCHASDATRIGQVEVVNGRYLAFDGPYAYVSSYAGPVMVGENSPLGRVYKVDTLTLQKVDSVTVGYQPEEMAIAHGRLYVANSGGYRPPAYDDRVTMIDLQTFTVEKHVPVAINLHRLVADHHGRLWMSSRGDYLTTPSRLCWLDKDSHVGSIDHPVSAMTLVGDSLYCIGANFSYLTGRHEHTAFIVDVNRCEVMPTSLFDDAAIQSMTLPYGIEVNPIERDFYLMDAKNYVSSGELLHFHPDGTFDWRVRTGDIPSRGAFHLLTQSKKTH